MSLYDKVKTYYERGYYTKSMVADFVKRGKLTPAQYYTITGEEYPGTEVTND